MCLAVVKTLWVIHEVKAEDDVVLDWCASQLSDSGDAGKGAAHGVATADENLWLPGIDITYCFIQKPQHATRYRRGCIAETFWYHEDIVFLKFNYVDYNPNSLANIHIYFGEIAGGESMIWSAIGKQPLPSQLLDGFPSDAADASMILSEVIPETQAEAQDESVKQVEQRTLQHEISHALGLMHEHVSPLTKTTDQPESDERVSVATPFGGKSVMLYVDRQLKDTSAWKTLEPYFNKDLTELNHQEFLMNHTVTNTFSTSSQSSKANTSKSDCNFFFGFYHSESSSAS